MYVKSNIRSVRSLHQPLQQLMISYQISQDILQRLEGNSILLSCILTFAYSDVQAILKILRHQFPCQEVPMVGVFALLLALPPLLDSGVLDKPVHFHFLSGNPSVQIKHLCHLLGLIIERMRAKKV